MNKNEFFHAVICNPPFHASAAEAAGASQRKTRNLKLESATPLNFGGQHNELWCEGGEKAFVGKMIAESAALARQCVWFTSLVSRRENLPALEKQLQALDAAEVRVVNMAQGQKPVSYTHLRAHETPEHLVCRLLLEIATDDVTVSYTHLTLPTKA